MTLDEMRRDFILRRRGSLALPIVGAVVYAAAALIGLAVAPAWRNLVLALCFWTIPPLGALVMKWRGETASPDNPLFRLSGMARIMALATWSVHLMVWIYAPDLFPVTVGILFALHWVVFSWMVGDPVGLWHLGIRILLVIAAWHLMPANRMSGVAAAVALAYALTLPLLRRLYRRTLNNPATP